MTAVIFCAAAASTSTGPQGATGGSLPTDPNVTQLFMHFAIRTKQIFQNATYSEKFFRFSPDAFKEYNELVEDQQIKSCISTILSMFEILTEKCEDHPDLLPYNSEFFDFHEQETPSRDLDSILQMDAIDVLDMVSNDLGLVSTLFMDPGQEVLALDIKGNRLSFFPGKFLWEQHKQELESKNIPHPQVDVLIHKLQREEDLLGTKRRSYPEKMKRQPRLSIGTPTTHHSKTIVDESDTSPDHDEQQAEKSLGTIDLLQKLESLKRLIIENIDIGSDVSLKCDILYENTIERVWLDNLSFFFSTLLDSNMTLEQLYALTDLYTQDQIETKASLERKQSDLQEQIDSIITEQDISHEACLRDASQLRSLLMAEQSGLPSYSVQTQLSSLVYDLLNFDKQETPRRRRSRRSSYPSRRNSLPNTT